MRRLCTGVVLACLCAPAAWAADPAVRAWRSANEKAVVASLAELVAMPNVADDVAAVRGNADHLSAQLQARGFRTRLLSAAADTPPAVFGELRTPGATRTVVFYAHFDGQPVDQPGWTSAPWTPVMRDASGRELDWRAAARLDPDWRLYGRSTSDDKGPIIALLSALDALKAAGRRPSVNIKVFLEGEEEQGSPTLRQILQQNAELLRADLWIMADGPMHPTRRHQVVFGVRGITGLELTVYGPARPLHSGNYGNWAPNPAVEAARLVASMRDGDGRILIPGFAEDVRPLTEAERRAVERQPNVEGEFRRELLLGRVEDDRPLSQAILSPALNIRGLAAGAVGEASANAIPTHARVSIDFRLVPNQTPETVRRRVETHLRSLGWLVLDREPTPEERLANPRVIKAEWASGYAPSRTDMSLPASRAVVATVQRAVGAAPIEVPTLGGSLPLSIFQEVVGAPTVTVPMVNHDNNQHGANENLRLQNLWDGIELYAALMTDLRW